MARKPAHSVTQTISSSPGASGTWTDALSATFENASGFLNIHVYGATWSATVTMQKSFDSGSNWYAVTTWTANAERSITDLEEAVTYRIGVANGDFSSGSVDVRLSN